MSRALDLLAEAPGEPIAVEAGRVAAGRAHFRQAGAAGAPGLPRGRRRRRARVSMDTPRRLRGP